MYALANLLLLPVGFIVVVVLVYQIRSWLHGRRMRREGRWIKWTEFDRRARLGEGCIIVNYGNIQGRVWWVSELCDEPVSYSLLDVAFLTNCPIRLRGTQLLRQKYPNATVVETHDCIL